MADSRQEAEADNAKREAHLAGGVTERTFLRLTFWQTILSLAGVFTGVVALYAALNESQAVREQTAASVWPYVQIIFNDSDDGSAAHFSMSFENVGVGPARMRGIQLQFGGVSVNSWEEVSARLLGEPARVGVDFGQSSAGRRVIAAGERIEIFQTNNAGLARALQKAVYGSDAELRYCYCSIFDQCWLAALTPQSDFEGPAEVESCPVFGADAFGG
ncbi:MAG: hypothetical protein V2I82_12285 [Halieaceae bacterium]|jgi:hypothetical protein|nr:hypothetical protein [Halieaceae bacterium]